MQIRLYNSSNNNHIALRFAEVTSRQLVMPFMLSKPVTQLRMQIVQKIGSVETILAQEYYRHTGFRLTNVVLDGSTLKIYANGSIIRTVTVTPVTVNRLELTGGAKKLLVDEMFVAPQAATADDIETWYNLDQQFLDENEIIAHEGAGANLLIDKFGIRATRKADNVETFRVDTETGDAFFKGDITGASGTFADGQVAIGDVSGKPWGSGVLPSGTPGIWGDQAGLYLRGYPKIVAFGSLSDEGVLELPPDVTGNPIMQLSLSQIVVPEIGTTILANYVYNPEARTFKVQGKIIALSPPRTLPGIGSQGNQLNGYTHTVPSTADEGGIYGRKMNTVTIKAGFGAPSSATCVLKVYTNCEFGGDGKPVESEWKIQHFFLLDRGVGGGYSGYWPLLTLNLPQVYGEDTRYALRFIDDSKVAFYTSKTWVESIEYRENTFYDIEGAEVGPTDPSRIELSYIVFEQG